MIPSNTIELVKWLEEVYPDKAPRYRMSEFDLGMLAGYQEIIDTLKSHIEGKAEAGLKDKV